MNTYLLVHGAWNGAWCWRRVIPLLEQEGHKVIAFDLPGHGSDGTPATDVSLQAYADSVCVWLDAQPEPVILVGHSMGGIVISQAAEHRPQKIKTLVFLAALLLRDGESLFGAAQQNQGSLISPNLIVDEPRGVATLHEGAIKEIFYGNCSDEDAAWAKSLFRPEPLAPWTAPVRISEDRFGQIPRVYIACLRDRAVSPALQRQMHTAMPCRQVFSMDTDHSPFFSAPAELVAHLIRL